MFFFHKTDILIQLLLKQYEKLLCFLLCGIVLFVSRIKQLDKFIHIDIPLGKYNFIVLNNFNTSISTSHGKNQLSAYLRSSQASGSISFDTSSVMYKKAENHDSFSRFSAHPISPSSSVIT